MDEQSMRAAESRGLSRRGFLGAAALGAASAGRATVSVTAADGEAALAAAVAKLSYLTPIEAFRTFVREKPRIDELPPEKLAAAGLQADTWRLEVVPDLESGAKVERPLSKERGTALTWQDLQALAERHAVRFLGLLACTNMDGPCGMGLWEGVPLREVLWRAQPAGNVRRVYYHGYHNDDGAQRFQSSLPLSRVLEDPPGELPVILCYKLNGKPLSVHEGGPVRMVVPESYGNRWVKWLTRIILTNDFKANDTYAGWNNDVESPLKTCARFIDPPKEAAAGSSVPLVGLAHVGVSGLRKVQYSVLPQDVALPADDPFVERMEWKDAAILPSPKDWGGGLPGGRLPAMPLQFDPATGAPRTWPLRFTIAHWAALMGPLRPGKYDLRCRTIDGNGIAQPMPRPLPKTGNNAIHKVQLVVKA